MTINFLETFSGIGGFRAALEQAIRERIERGLPVPGEFRCIGHSEISEWAERVYRRHWPDTPNLGDITQLDTSRLGGLDFLLGGFPCQAFSSVGLQLGFDDTRGTLFFELARVLADKKPRYFVFENVRGLLSHDGGRTFATILGVLTDLGYHVEWQVLNSKDHGVPQNRERVVLVGHRGGRPARAVFPLTGPGGPDESDPGRGRDTGAPGPGGPVADGEYFFNASTRRDPVYVGREQSTCIDANYHKGLDNHGSRSGVAVVRAGVARLRRFTPIECERLQGFPDGWTAEGTLPDGRAVVPSDGARYSLLGNAVTVPVFVAVFHRLLEVWAAADAP